MELDDPVWRHVVMPGIPSEMSVTSGEVGGPAPSVGGEGATWSSPDRAWRGAKDARSKEGPLEGIRVIDLGAIIAGPLAASLLVELGAEGIKLEPLTGDSYRGPGFAAHNKGKRGIALDLRHPKGHRAFLELASSADVVVDNYRPGVLERLGARYEDLRAINPDIVTVTITGFGERGPLGSEAGFDPVLQAMSGMMTAQGGDSDPVFHTVPVNDVAASAMGAFGASLALFHRERSGEGQKVSTSLAAISAFVQAGELVRWEGRPPPSVGGRDFPGPSALDRYYRTADGWLRLCGTGPEARDALERAGFLPALEGGEGEIEAVLASVFAGLGRDEAVSALTAAGIAAAPARTASELASDPELVEYQVLQPDARPGRSGWWTAGRYARLSRTERSGTLVAPHLGQHTREVLLSAGLSPDEVEDLLASGAAIEASATESALARPSPRAGS
jgi:crotonobetainyl-CoA:carnitine CoA-transferase CaiB-like acyl-CoA transferase